jgi:hypothetical protein
MSSCCSSKCPTREVKNEVQDSRSRSVGVHCGSIGHHCKCCSPQGCCWPSAFHACARRRSSFQLAVSGGNTAAVKAGCCSPEVSVVQRWGGTANCIGCSWNWWGTGCNWNWWTGRSERWTGCFVLGLALAVPLFIGARHNKGGPASSSRLIFENSEPAFRRPRCRLEFDTLDGLWQRVFSRPNRVMRRATDRSGIAGDSMIFNTDLAGALAFDNMIAQASASLHSAIGRTEGRGAHAREDFPKTAYSCLAR